MKALRKVVILCGLFWLPGYAALAQTPDATCSASGRSFGPLGVSSVSGCPFSADIEIDRSQTLADGTHIQTSNKAHSYRNSQGRVRYESSAPTNVGKDVPETPNLILIYDPVAGFIYSLAGQTAVAYRRKLPENATSPGIAEHPKGAASAASPPAQDERPRTEVENLGTQRLEGLLSIGTRTTRTIPAGMEGNDRVLTVVGETWRSQDWGVTLLEKRSDPRTGETEMRLTNLEQSEPDAALFQVPADDTIKDQ
jgi:hypothetical protein